MQESATIDASVIALIETNIVDFNIATVNVGSIIVEFTTWLLALDITDLVDAEGAAIDASAFAVIIGGMVESSQFSSLIMIMETLKMIEFEAGIVIAAEVVEANIEAFVQAFIAVFNFDIDVSVVEVSVLIEAVNAAFAVVVGFEADITVAITFIEAQFVFLVEFCVLIIEDFCIGPVADGLADTFFTTFACECAADDGNGNALALRLLPTGVSSCDIEVGFVQYIFVQFLAAAEATFGDVYALFTEEVISGMDFLALSSGSVLIELRGLFLELGADGALIEEFVFSDMFKVFVFIVEVAKYIQDQFLIFEINSNLEFAQLMMKMVSFDTAFADINAAIFITFFTDNEDVLLAMFPFHLSFDMVDVLASIDAQFSIIFEFLNFVETDFCFGQTLFSVTNDAAQGFFVTFNCECSDAIAFYEDGVTECVPCYGDTAVLDGNTCTCDDGYLQSETSQCVLCDEASATLNGEVCECLDDSHLLQPSTGVCIPCSGPDDSFSLDDNEECLCTDGFLIREDSVCVPCDSEHGQLNADGECECKEPVLRILSEETNLCIACSTAATGVGAPSLSSSDECLCAINSVLNADGVCELQYRTDLFIIYQVMFGIFSSELDVLEAIMIKFSEFENLAAMSPVAAGVEVTLIVSLRQTLLQIESLTAEQVNDLVARQEFIRLAFILETLLEFNAQFTDVDIMAECTNIVGFYDILNGFEAKLSAITYNAFSDIVILFEGFFGEIDISAALIALNTEVNYLNFKASASLTVGKFCEGFVANDELVEFVKTFVCECEPTFETIVDPVTGYTTCFCADGQTQVDGACVADNLVVSMTKTVVITGSITTAYRYEEALGDPTSALFQEYAATVEREMTTIMLRSSTVTSITMKVTKFVLVTGGRRRRQAPTDAKAKAEFEAEAEVPEDTPADDVGTALEDEVKKASDDGNEALDSASFNTVGVAAEDVTTTAATTTTTAAPTTTTTTTTSTTTTSTEATTTTTAATTTTTTKTTTTVTTTTTTTTSAADSTTTTKAATTTTTSSTVAPTTTTVTTTITTTTAPTTTTPPPTTTTSTVTTKSTIATTTTTTTTKAPTTTTSTTKPETTTSTVAPADATTKTTTTVAPADATTKTTTTVAPADATTKTTTTVASDASDATTKTEPEMPSPGDIEDTASEDNQDSEISGVNQDNTNQGVPIANNVNTETPNIGASDEDGKMPFEDAQKIFVPIIVIFTVVSIALAIGFIIKAGKTASAIKYGGIFIGTWFKYFHCSDMKKIIFRYYSFTQR